MTSHIELPSLEENPSKLIFIRSKTLKAVAVKTSRTAQRQQVETAGEYKKMGTWK